MGKVGHSELVEPVRLQEVQLAVRQEVPVVEQARQVQEGRDRIASNNHLWNNLLLCWEAGLVRRQWHCCIGTDRLVVGEKAVVVDHR